MNNNAKIFTVISASAGSGKTYRIAKEYVKYVLKHPYEIGDILAITFTNKAAAEMKGRILLFLKALSKRNDIISKDSKKLSTLPKEILDELNTEDNGNNWSNQQIEQKAKIALENILYGGNGGGYSDFSVMTIDAFTTRMTKVFAYELNIPPDYAVGMNMKNIIRNSVDKVIAQADPSTEEGMNITEIIINHLLYQIEQNKGLMIENEINSIANNLRKLEKSFDRKIEIPNNFKKNFKKALADTRAYVKQVQDYVKSECIKMLDNAKTFHNGEIDYTMYVQGSRGFYSYVKKYVNNQCTDTMVSLLNKRYYQDVINEGIEKLRKKGKLQSSQAEQYLNNTITTAINLDRYIRNHIEEYLIKTIIMKRIYGNILFERVNELIEKYQDENGIIFIDELNHKISNLFEGKGEVPFVYFRMSESFKKYMIDEFQDTSMVQWRNIEPLVENSMSEGEMSITVGDLKQAIYRFRGGSTDVMSELIANPMVQQENLESNWRSDPNIIALNNFFFTDILQNTSFIPKSIYDGDNVKQKYAREETPVFTDNEKTGYCELNLINKETDMKELMLKKRELVKIIRDVLSRGYEQSSIGILVRTNGEGNEVAELLSSDDEDVKDINILSADTLFIKDNPYVDFIINVLKFSMDNNNNEAFARLVHLWNDISKSREAYENARDFIIRRLNEKGKKSFSLDKNDREEVLKLLWGGDVFNEYQKRIRNTVNSISVYESTNLIMEIIINPLCKDYSQSIAHITKLRDIAYKRMKEENTYNFLKYYDEYKNDLNIPAPASKNAVTISTVHKAKGLQYEVVIVPFAKWDGKKNHSKEYFIYDNPEIAVKYGDINDDYKDYMSEIIQDTKSKSEEEVFFDDLNLLYVAMTRACEELYIYSNRHESEKETIEKVFTGKFEELKEKDVEQTENEFYESISIGKKRMSGNKTKEIKRNHAHLIAYSHKSHMFIDRKMNYIISKHKTEEEQITHGKIIHEALALMNNEHDTDRAIASLLRNGIITEGEAEHYRNELYEIVRSDKFSIMFDDGYEVLNERNIICRDKDSNAFAVRRPDRVLIKHDNVLIFDYKTGGHDKKYEQQLREYMDAYKEMGYKARGFIAYTLNKQLQEVKA